MDIAAEKLDLIDWILKLEKEEVLLDLLKLKQAHEAGQKKKGSNSNGVDPEGQER